MSECNRMGALVMSSKRLNRFRLDVAADHLIWNRWFLISEMRALEYDLKSRQLFFEYFSSQDCSWILILWLNANRRGGVTNRILLYFCLSDSSDNFRFISDHVLCVCAKIGKQSFLYDGISSVLSRGMKNDLLKRVKEFISRQATELC